MANPNSALPNLPVADPLSPEESQQVLSAIRSGEVDALVVSGPNGQRVYTLEGADTFSHTLIENMNGGALILDPDGDILFSNGPFSDLLQRSPAFLMHTALRDHVLPESRVVVEDLLARSALGKCSGEVVLRAADRSTVPVRLCLSGLSHGAVCAIVTDLTEQKRAEEALRQSERLAAIGQMITGLSHESRNALQRSLTCLELLARRFATQPHVLQLVGEARAAQSDLQRVLEEVREYAAPLALELKEEDIVESWRDTWVALRTMRQGRHVVLRETVNASATRCVMDSFRLRQVFRNLLENALAACSDPVVIDIVCDRVQENGVEYLAIAISDNGPGLSREQHERIFEPFFTTKTKGTGLGMAIVRRIIEAHQGEIRIDPGFGTGLTVHFTIPCCEA